MDVVLSINIKSFKNNGILLACIFLGFLLKIQEQQARIFVVLRGLYQEPSQYFGNLVSKLDVLFPEKTLFFFNRERVRNLTAEELEAYTIAHLITLVYAKALGVDVGGPAAPVVLDYYPPALKVLKDVDFKVDPAYNAVRWAKALINYILIDPLTSELLDVKYILADSIKEEAGEENPMTVEFAEITPIIAYVLLRRVFKRDKALGFYIDPAQDPSQDEYQYIDQEQEDDFEEETYTYHYTYHYRNQNQDKNQDQDIK